MHLPNTDVTCGMMLFCCFALPFCFFARLYFKPDKPLMLIRNNTQQNGWWGKRKEKKKKKNNRELKKVLILSFTCRPDWILIPRSSTRSLIISYALHGRQKDNTPHMHYRSCKVVVFASSTGYSELLLWSSTFPDKTHCSTTPRPQLYLSRIQK